MKDAPIKEATLVPIPVAMGCNNPGTVGVMALAILETSVVQTHNMDPPTKPVIVLYVSPI
jgi:hypothetical protein